MTGDPATSSVKRIEEWQPLTMAPARIKVTARPSYYTLYGILLVAASVICNGVGKLPVETAPRELPLVSHSC